MFRSIVGSGAKCHREILASSCLACKSFAECAGKTSTGRVHGFLNMSAVVDEAKWAIGKAAVMLFGVPPSGP